MNTMPWWGWVVVLVISFAAAWHIDRRRRSEILDEQARTLLREEPGSTARCALAYKIGGDRYGRELLVRARKIEGRRLSTAETKRILGANEVIPVRSVQEGLALWWERRYNRKGKVATPRRWPRRPADDLDDDPPACPHCGAMAGCCDSYPNCPGGKPA